jgi:hypothetical protein
MRLNTKRSLLTILVDARTNRWCTQIPCTTCGCRELRSALELLKTNEILQDLGNLSAKEIDSYSTIVHAVLTWLRHARWVATPSDFDAIKGSEVWKIIVLDYKEYHLRSINGSNDN